MNTIAIGNKFQMKQIGSLGLTGFKIAVLNGADEEIAYVKRGKKLSSGINIFADKKMTQILLSLSKGTMSDSANNSLGSIQGKMLISKNPLTITTSEGTIAEVKTSSLLKQYIRNTGYSFVPVVYQLFVADEKIATYSLPLTLGKSKLFCEVEKSNILDSDILVILGSILILGY